MTLLVVAIGLRAPGLFVGALEGLTGVLVALFVVAALQRLAPGRDSE